MADAGLRDLERAVAAGDDGAGLSLAAAYLRGGQAAAALDVLTRLEVGQADDLEARAWDGTLVSLRPTTKVPGARLYHSLRGWVGDRYAAIRVHQSESFVVLDRDSEDLLPLRGLPQPTRLHGVCPSGLICMTRASATLLRIEDGAWVPEHLPMLQDPQTTPYPVDLSADEQWLVSFTGIVGPRGTEKELRIQHLPSGRTHSQRCGAYAYDWERDLLVWTCPQGLGVSTLTGEGPSEIVALHRSGVDPLSLFCLLRDGRLATGRPAALFDPASPGPLRSISPGEVHGPVKLSRDGRDLLCVQAGHPARLPLLGSARSAQGFAQVSEPCLWHPRADLAVWGGHDRQAELLHFAPGRARARVVLRFPLGLWPLGWTPDGRGLLLVRKLTGMQGLLELWTVEGGP